MGASWLMDSSWKSQQDANTCFPKLDARLFTSSMKARCRVFASIMSDWWAASCATSINNSFAQFEWSERFTNVKVGYAYFFWKMCSSCIYIQYMDISMHMPKDQNCYKHLMWKWLVFNVVLICFLDVSLKKNTSRVSDLKLCSDLSKPDISLYKMLNIIITHQFRPISIQFRGLKFK